MLCQLLVDEPPLQVIPSLAKAIGLNEAIIIQQVHYWLNPRFNKNYFEGCYWVWNTYGQWQQQFPFLSRNTIIRAIGNMEKSGLLISFVPHGLRKTKHYTINYGRLGQIYERLAMEPAASPGDQKGQSPEWFMADNWNHPLGANPHKPVQIQPAQAQGSCLPTQTGVVDCSQRATPTQHGIVALPKMGRPNHMGTGDAAPGIALLPQAQGSCPPTQTGVVDCSQPATPTQYGIVDLPKMGRPNNMDTENTVPEITLLPPSPPSPQPLVQNQGFGEGEGENQIFGQLLEAWNQDVQLKLHPGKGVHLTLKRQELLRQFLATVFPSRDRQGQLDSWRGYCTMVASSRFLAGDNPSGFKATLDWALVPVNAFKVLEGAIYDRPVEQAFVEKPWAELEGEMQQSLPPGLYTPQWLEVCRALVGSIGQKSFKSWFMDTSLGVLSSTHAVVQVKTRFMKDCINSRFRFDVERAIRSLYPTVKQIDFQVSP